LPLRAAVAKGLVGILYLSRENVRAGQLLTVLADKIRALDARRLVLDSVNQIGTDGMSQDELRQLLYNLVGRFKTLGVTSLLTLEAASLYSTESVTERALSPIADNLLMARYAKVDDQLAPTLTVIKTRGSAHDRGTYAIAIGKGGIRIGPPVSESPSPTNRSAEGAKRSRKKRR
jgi:circadian clock protein KaiC